MENCSNLCIKIVFVSYHNPTKFVTILFLVILRDAVPMNFISAAGIPDFRSPGTGLYHNLQKYNLPHPQAIFELDFFKDNPKPFFELAKELYPGKFKPTICHYFIKLLADKGMLLRHYTQNIDALERVAGVPEETLVEAHGTFYTGHCLNCRHIYSIEWLKGISDILKYHLSYFRVMKQF